MSRVISITNCKGGVGKTTTALNLGAALSDSGKRVLLIDSDPQGNLTAAMGYTPAELKYTLTTRKILPCTSTAPCFRPPAAPT